MVGSLRPGRSAWAACALATVLFLAPPPGSAVGAPAGRAKAAVCGTCHGEDGISVQPNVPNLAGQPAIYLADQLRQYRSGRRAHEVMSVVAKPLSDQDIDDLAAWFASIAVEVRVPR